MARLYNGFNALGIGQAINNVNQQNAANRISGINALAGSMQDFFRAKAERDKEEQRRQSAIDYLTGTAGVDSKQAEGIVGAIDPSEAARFFMGRLGQKEDTAAQQEYEEKIHGRNRGEQLEDRAAEWEHEFNTWKKKYGITTDQDIESSMFNKYVELLLSNNMKDWGNSIRGVEQQNAIIDAITDFAEKHPKYKGSWDRLKSVFGEKGDTSNGLYDEPMAAELRKLGGKNHTDKEREDYLNYLLDNNKYDYIMTNPYFNDAKTAFFANVDNKNLMPYVLLQKLIGSNTTQTQRNKEINNADFNNRVNSLYDEILNAARGKGEFPKVNDKELKALEKKFGKNQRFLSRYKRG